MCKWLNVSPSGDDDWKNLEPSKRQKEDVELMERIKVIHAASRTTYGSPRVHRSLRLEGIRVARLMRESGLKGRVVTVTRRTPRLRAFQQAGDNLRLNTPPLTSCDSEWVADITFIKVGQQYQHLITIMDVYSRRILGWSLRQHRTADDVLQLLKRVINKRRPKPGLIFHTDRGIEFMAYAIQNELRKHGIKCSYNRLGHCTDNAHMESFYHSLKGELIRGRLFRTEESLRRPLSSYIDGFYNRARLHSGIGYYSPIHYEKHAA
ncbi:MAG: IS3 family transposase [Gammaproteobacteria bacterium]|nr:IS3 family transposase [Gammaproteobacteria bacterium]